MSDFSFFYGQFEAESELMFPGVNKTIDLFRPSSLELVCNHWLERGNNIDEGGQSKQLSGIEQMDDELLDDINALLNLEDEDEAQADDSIMPLDQQRPQIIGNWDIQLTQTIFEIYEREFWCALKKYGYNSIVE
ncbi:hypothetical protein WICPIJ_005595 [Wickerhamomyces pijperi]|uniref:Uncharacterized protein n=1 Tax=Wickerhamomyces pijperi TaxID=599730 RepID=A0A9P8Q3N6_WICPI|nr:hypothetical protein WICPIJ_005595 [Wickerhamomyces pijperi]